MKLKVFAIACLSLFNTDAQVFQPKPTDIPFQYTFGLPENTYHKYCKIIYSQNGEDGILEQLLKELGISKGTFCEFGASNGITSSNTFNLIQKGFSGISIELDPELYKQCVENYKLFPQVQVFQGGVFYNNPNVDLNAWLIKGGLPVDFDILSIDIDRDDYYVWEGLTKFNPKIVIFETNPYRDPVYDELPGYASIEYNIDPLKEWYPSRVASGCSFIAAIKLGLSKGYIPVACAGNITFVRKDLVHKLKEFPYIISGNPYDYLTLYTHLVLWGDKWYTNTGLILNVAIRDYYLTFKTKHIDVEWLQERMHQIAHNENVIW